MKINWKQKLTSRKFWAAIIGFVSTLCIVLGVDQLTTQQIIAVIGALATLIAYIIGEGLADRSRNIEKTIKEETEKGGNENK